MKNVTSRDKSFRFLPMLIISYVSIRWNKNSDQFLYVTHAKKDEKRTKNIDLSGKQHIASAPSLQRTLLNRAIRMNKLRTIYGSYHLGDILVQLECVSLGNHGANCF